MPRAAKRLTFWILFLALAGVGFWQIWIKFDPLRNHPVVASWWLHRNLAQLSSPDPATGAQAWRELDRLYSTRWAAYDYIVWQVKRDIWKTGRPSIHFRLVRSGGRYQPEAVAGGGDCRTVNDALMAMLYQEPARRTAYEGDWRKWWDANWTFFPNRELQGLPSGPEDPRGRR